MYIYGHKSSLLEIQRVKIKVKVKQSLYRPGQALRSPGEVETPRISRQSTHEGGKVVGRTYRPFLTPRSITVILILVGG